MTYSVCVYCGSRSGARDSYAEDAAKLGTALAEAGMRLVYGAGDVGLMGAVASTVHNAGGRVTGVIPKGLADIEVRSLKRPLYTDDS